MDGQYNLRNPAVKRLMKEAREMKDATELFHAQPLEDNLFEWHFTIRGPSDSEFDGGIYHGRIILPPEYPMKPPSIILLTPNGRFEVNKKICLSISGFHPESWQPSWSIRTALLAIIGFMPSHGNGAIGSLDYTAEERKQLAKKTVDWSCASCGNIRQILLPITEASNADIKEAKELAHQINFQGEKEKNASTSSTASLSPTAAGGDQNTPASSPPFVQPMPPSFCPWFVFPPPGLQPPYSTAASAQLPPWPPQNFTFPMTWPPYVPPHMSPATGSALTYNVGTNPLYAMAHGAIPIPPISTGACLSSSRVDVLVTSNVQTSETITTTPASQSTTSTAASQDTTTTTTTPSASVAATTSSTTATDSRTAVSGAEGLRHRAVPSVTETRHSAEIVHRVPRRGDRALTVLMIVVGIVLLLLVIRRLGVFTLFDQDNEF